jgi:RNA polymerase sigma-70 factor (ECF subfamily)
MENYDEKEVAAGISTGSVPAFRQLVERYKKKVFYLAFDMLGKHHEAEDISQEVFIKVYRHRHKIDRIDQISTWIHRITVNTCIDQLRKKSRKNQVNLENDTLDALNYQAAAEQNPSSDPEKDLVIQSQISHLLKAVTPRERSVVILRYIQGFKISEIAQTLKVSEGAIKSLLVRARRKMQARQVMRPVQSA